MQFKKFTLLVVLCSLTLELFGQQPYYKVFVTEAKKVVKVEAQLPFKEDNISMFVRPTNELPEGEATFVQNLIVKDEKGTIIPTAYQKEGDWKLSYATTPKYLNIQYEIKLEHEKYPLDEVGGIDEVAYIASDGLFFTGYTLFMYTDIEQKNIQVEFVLPPSWRAATPWLSMPKTHTFEVESSRYLLNNCLFVGTAQMETIRLGDMQIQIAMGGRFKNSKVMEMYSRTLNTLVASYQKLFGGSMAKNYLVVVNEGNMNDGSAFRQSYSQIAQDDITENSSVVWGHLIAHEAFHLWNGLTIVPQESKEDWFKEGVTDYMSVVLLSRNRLITEEILYKKLENFNRRYLIAKRLQGISSSVREAGLNKSQNRMLIYGQGALLGFAIDVQIREKTQNQRSLDNVLRQLYEEFGKSRKPYSYQDVLRICNQVSGSDMSPFFEQYINGNAWLDSTPYFQKCGLDLSTMLEEMYISPKANSSHQEKLLFNGIFKNN